MYNYNGLKILNKYQYSSNNMKKKINDIEIFNIFQDLDKAVEGSNFGKRNIYAKGFFNLINQSNKSTNNADLCNFNVNIYWLELQRNDLKNSINKLVTDIENTFKNLKSNLNENFIEELNKSEKRIQNIFEKRKNDFVFLNNQLDIFSKMLNEAEIKEIEAKNEISKIAVEVLRNSSMEETNISEKGCFDNFIKYKLKYKNKLNKIYKEGILDYKLLNEIKKELRDELKSTFMYLLNENVILNKYYDKTFLNNLIKMREDKSNLNEFGINLCFSGLNEYHNIGLKRNNELVMMFDSEDVIDIIREEFKLILKTKYNKNPNIVKFFIDKEEEFSKNNRCLDCDKIMLIDSLINKYLENKNILDNNSFNFFKEFDESVEKAKLLNLNVNNGLIPYGSNIDISKVCEFFEDKTKKIINEHNVKNFAKSILSNKYIHLLNDDNIKVIKEIYDLKLKKDTFQKYIGKKIAKYKTPEEFNEGLNSFLTSFNSFTKEAIINKANDHGAEIIDIGDYTNDLLVLKINNFEQSKFLGSQSWCISTTESYFKSYANDNEQYFIYNFTFPQTSEESMIGLTLDNGEFSAGFYKDDSEVDPNSSEIEEYIEMINSSFDNKLKDVISEKHKNNIN